MAEKNAPVNPAANLRTYPESASASDNDVMAIAAALDHSRPLDIHRWSDFPEADAFVDKVYERCGGKHTAIERKNFKVVLLDLYVAWLIDPDIKTAVAMTPSAYKANSRYNALHISRLVINVVNRLSDAGLIGLAPGFHDRTGRGQGRQTRIWPSDALVALFRAGQLDERKIGRAANEEVIVLRDATDKKRKVEYDDTPETCRMRQVVNDYNELLARHFIDIRRLENPWIEKEDGTRLMLGPSQQRVHRVFNRGSFLHGGRFYGPWWQQCPKEWRREIFINDAPTIEQDYSSLHIALLYARRGVNFYRDHATDAYAVETPIFLDTEMDTRRYAKRLLLTAVNAKSDKATYKAFRSQCNDSGDKIGGTLTDKELAVLLDSLRNKHPLIGDDLATDAGVGLMYDDSRITEHVIKRFMAHGVAVLTIHDSYISHYQDHALLQDAMAEAFHMVTGMDGIRSERTGVAGDMTQWETDRLELSRLKRSHGYNQRQIDWMAYRR